MLPVDDRIMNIAIQGGAPDQRINTRNFAPQGILIKKRRTARSMIAKCTTFDHPSPKRHSTET